MLLDQEPLWYPSRGPFNPGVSNRQLWAIGMVVVQWGMAEYIRKQSIAHLIGNDSKLAAQFKAIRNSEKETEFWKMLVELKMSEPQRAKSLEFITRFQQLNDRRDHIVHRMWGGGGEANTMGVPADLPTMDASLHRQRDERKKTKSKDGRANLHWRLNFTELRKIVNNIAQLNLDILTSWLPPGSPPGMYNVWAVPNAQGQLEVGIASASESNPTILKE